MGRLSCSRHSRAASKLEPTRCVHISKQTERVTYSASRRSPVRGKEMGFGYFLVDNYDGIMRLDLACLRLNIGTEIYLRLFFSLTSYRMKNFSSKEKTF